MAKSLAIKYRPKNFSDVVEQGSTIAILTNQINTDSVKSAYLFVGGAGTGKTTSARIFANMINKGAGTPIELDAASNNSVEDIRRLTEDAQTQSIDSEYKVFVIDECHSLSNQAWQAMLKTLEEPPAKAIFIFCTTNPERIPQTILSRVQRYNFQRISQEGIVTRLEYILTREISTVMPEYKDALEYIAKIADGGMRDAITLMDKCLSFSSDLTVENVIKALGVADYNTMFDLNNAFFEKDKPKLIKIVSDVYSSGMDLKLFIKTYFEFLLDLNVYCLTKDLSMTKIPEIWVDEMKSYGSHEWSVSNNLLTYITDLQSSIKWEQNPKAVIIAKFILFEED